LPPGLDRQLGRAALRRLILVVEHSPTSVIGRAVGARVGGLGVLVVEISAPTHPAMLVEAPGGVQYPPVILWPPARPGASKGTSSVLFGPKVGG
jgi:hypothetical protein